MLSIAVYRQNVKDSLSFSMYKAIDINKIIGRNLKRLRKAAGLTQEKLGEMINVNGVYIAQIEKGTRGMGKEIMSRLCNIFKIEPAEFFIDHKTLIPATELEKQALYTIREAERLGVSYIAEESVEYTKHRLEIVKKQKKTSHKPSKTVRFKNS